MEILLLYNNEIAKKLAGKLQEAGHRVTSWEKEIQMEDLEKMNLGRVISYTYRFIIPKDMIEMLQSPILNLHISYLPWNRGADPNFWSFMEDTPKGVTIHEVNEKIDGGRILLQKELFFDESEETFSSAYEKLNEEIISLFLRHSQKLLEGTTEKAQEGIMTSQKGSYHSKKQLEHFREIHPFSWEENIADFKARINGRKMRLI